MKVRITKPTRVNLLSGEVEVSEQEYNRLLILGAAEPLTEKEMRETPEAEKKKTTRKK